MGKKAKELKAFTFDITGVDYDANLKEFKSVLLNGKEIFKIDLTKYMGIKKDYTKEVLEVLTKKLKREITKEDLQRAITFGTIYGY